MRSVSVWQYINPRAYISHSTIISPLCCVGFLSKLGWNAYLGQPPKPASQKRNEMKTQKGWINVFGEKCDSSQQKITLTKTKATCFIAGSPTTHLFSQPISHFFMCLLWPAFSSNWPEYIHVHTFTGLSLYNIVSQVQKLTDLTPRSSRIKGVKEVFISYTHTHTQTPVWGK